MRIYEAKAVENGKEDPASEPDKSPRHLADCEGGLIKGFKSDAPPVRLGPP
jgi:hypothetical protein